MRINRSLGESPKDVARIRLQRGGGKVARVHLILFLATDTRRLPSLAREKYVICLRPEEFPKNQPFFSDGAATRAKTLFPRVTRIYSDDIKRRVCFASERRLDLTNLNEHAKDIFLTTNLETL